VPSVSLPVSATNARPTHGRQDQRPSEHTEASFASLLDMAPADKPVRSDPPPRGNSDANRANTADDKRARSADRASDKAVDAANDRAAKSADDAQDDTPGTPTAADASGTTNPKESKASDQKADGPSDQSGDQTKDQATDAVDTAAVADPSQILAEQTPGAADATSANAATTTAVTPTVAPVQAVAGAASAISAAPIEASDATIQATAAVSAKTNATAVVSNDSEKPAGKAEAKTDITGGIDSDAAVADTAPPAVAHKAEKPAHKPAEIPAAARDGTTDGAQVATAAPAAPDDILAQAKAQASDKAHLDVAASKLQHGKPEAAGDQNTPAPQARTDANATMTSGFDIALQNTQPTTSTTSTVAVQTAQSTQAATASGTIPISGVAVEIVTRAKEDTRSFEIRLDPPELGKIHVKLDVDGQGNVTSRLTVDRQDTLDLLRRDSAGLERALNDAGLKTGDSGLQFSLRDQNSGNDGQREPTGQTSRIVVPNDGALPGDVARYQVTRHGGLDIRV
jgi:flagellar hook-length control protein FliK